MCQNTAYVVSYIGNPAPDTQLDVKMAIITIMEDTMPVSQLLSYPEALVLLYLYHHPFIVIPSYLIELQNLKQLPVLEVIYGKNLLTELPTVTAGSEKPDHDKKRALYHIPINGYCLVKKSKDSFKKFLAHYLSAYREHKFTQNPFNYFSFVHSWGNTVSFLNNQKEKLGPSFSITPQLLSGEESLKNPSARWVECILFALLREKLTLQGAEISFLDYNQENLSQNQVEAILDYPHFRFTVELLRPLRKTAATLIEYCGIEITCPEESLSSFDYSKLNVYYKEHLIPFETDSVQFFFLQFLVMYRGEVKSVKTFQEELKQWLKKVSISKRNPMSGNIIKRLESYRIETLKKFRKIASQYHVSVDFDITVGKTGLYLHPKTKNTP